MMPVIAAGLAALFAAAAQASGAVLRACAGCTVVADVPGAGHGSILSPQPMKLGGSVAELLRDPPGFDRAEVPRVHGLIVDFFRQHLLP